METGVRDTDREKEREREQEPARLCLRPWLRFDTTPLLAILLVRAHPKTTLDPRGNTSGLLMAAAAETRCQEC